MTEERDAKDPYIEISDDDIYEAMKDISGYIDITSEDFRELYLKAYSHAVERITTSIRASDVMNRNVITVKPDTPVVEVADIMSRHGISGVPVVNDDNMVLGVISEKDFLVRMGMQDTRTFMGVVSECLKGHSCAASAISGRRAEDLMSSPAVTVRGDVMVSEIADIFSEKGINRVPVVDEDGRLTGIVSRADIIGAPLKRRA